MTVIILSPNDIATVDVDFCSQLPRAVFENHNKVH